MKVLFPGSFDPVTLGHLDIIERAAKWADELVVAVFHNVRKKPFFTWQERQYFLKEATKSFSNVCIDVSEGLLSEYIRQNKIDVVVRGIRNQNDFINSAKYGIYNLRYKLPI